ncbi:hypothetical protein [Bdellovibrio sp. HCB2-146]|uniref:hypothetical protein n=1 Tax=Bdellovibrio sp. HCB2-146 TaxID=3394362 RepID=UPI0039BD7258
MKKAILGLATFLMSAQVYATATIRVPIVIIDYNETPVAMGPLNEQLKAVGLPTIPAYFEFSSNDSYEKMTAFNASVYKSFETLGLELEISSPHIPAPGTCYTGNYQDVKDAVSGLIDVFYSDQLQTWGYKYKNETIIFDEIGEAEETRDYLNQESEQWKNWSSKNEDILMLFATSDGGEDVNEALITRCK